MWIVPVSGSIAGAKEKKQLQNRKGKVALARNANRDEGAGRGRRQRLCFPYTISKILSAAFRLSNFSYTCAFSYKCPQVFPGQSRNYDFRTELHKIVKPSSLGQIFCRRYTRLSLSLSLSFIMCLFPITICTVPYLLHFIVSIFDN